VALDEDRNAVADGVLETMLAVDEKLLRIARAMRAVGKLQRRALQRTAQDLQGLRVQVK
jgi:hypothetical protein